MSSDSANDSKNMSNNSIDNSTYSLEQSTLSINQSMAKEMEQNFKNSYILYQTENFDDQIFKRLATKNEYLEAKECNICQKQSGFFKKLRNCHFCGKTVCKEDLKRRRRDPQNKDTLCKICMNCNNRYLNRIIYQELTQKEQQIKFIQENQQREIDLNNLELQKQEQNYQAKKLKNKQLEEQTINTTEKLVVEKKLAQQKLQDSLSNITLKTNHQERLHKEIISQEKEIKQLEKKQQEQQIELNLVEQQQQNLTQEIQASRQNIEDRLLMKKQEKPVHEYKIVSLVAPDSVFQSQVKPSSLNQKLQNQPIKVDKQCTLCNIF